MTTARPLPPEFAHPLQRSRARCAPLAVRCLWYPEITSTNDVAATLADAGAEEGVVVVADAQTAGRGRPGRVWASPPGAGIYATAILRPDATIAPLLTLAAGVAVAEGIEAATGLSPALKWPNDVVVLEGPGRQRKLAGVLAEASLGLAGPPQGGPHIKAPGLAGPPRGGPHVKACGGGGWVVLGFGINVLPAAYPPDVAARATSLEVEVGRRVDRGLVLAECLAAVARRYHDLREGRIASIVTAWRGRAASTLGRRVEFVAEGAVREGVACDVDAAGALLVQTSTGVARVVAGEVRWI